MALTLSDSPIATPIEYFESDFANRSYSPLPPHKSSATSIRSTSPESSEEEDSLPTRHTMYYIDDPMVIFLVDKRLFKVHRYFLTRESEVFKNMFASPSGPEDEEGNTDDKAVPLPGVTCAELRSLLDFFYKGMHDTYTPNRDTWIDILSISTRYIMDKVRARAIREIEYSYLANPLNPVKRISLAFKFEVPHWLPGAYCELCARAQTIQAAEADILGPNVTLRLFQAREAARQDGRYLPPLNQAECSPYVQEAFGMTFLPADV